VPVSVDWVDVEGVDERVSIWTERTGTREVGQRASSTVLAAARSPIICLLPAFAFCCFHSRFASPFTTQACRSIHSGLIGTGARSIPLPRSKQAIEIQARRPAMSDD